MVGVKELSCKTCGSLLDLTTAADGVVKCKYCGNSYAVPKEDGKSEAFEMLQIASHELETCSFDRAYTAYAKAAEISPDEPEAYFGMALARFKVQYLNDAAKKHLQPICHEITDKKFTDDKNYLRALELATKSQYGVYMQRGAEIDAISAEFGRIANSGLKYDCFICVKVSDNGGNTKDSYEALKLYNHLKKRGYSPFYSEEEIRGRAGVNYEALILYALYTAECMIVVCSNDEYLQTPWVKNEYTRFIELINDEKKDADAITIAFKGKPIERLPGKRALIQGVNLASADAYVNLEDYVESHTPQAKMRREAAAALAREKEAEKDRRLAELEQMQLNEQRRREQEEAARAEEQARKFAELEEKLARVNNPAPAQAGGISPEEMFAKMQEMQRKKEEEKKDAESDWLVCKDGALRPLRRFATKHEALAHAAELSKNSDETFFVRRKLL